MFVSECIAYAYKVVVICPAFEICAIRGTKNEGRRGFASASCMTRSLGNINIVGV